MFTFTKEEEQEYRDKYIRQGDKIVIPTFPSKEKRRYFLISVVAGLFEMNKEYHEKEINAILKDVYHDYVLLRRYLVDYQFLSRNADGSKYWKNVV